MRKLLLFFPLFLIGCTVSQKIVYKTDNITAPQSIKPIPANVEVWVFNDNRASLEENDVLFKNPRQVRLNGKQTCINSERHYKKDTVVNQLSKILVEHFNKAGLFRYVLLQTEPAK